MFQWLFLQMNCLSNLVLAKCSRTYIKYNLLYSKRGTLRANLKSLLRYYKKSPITTEKNVSTVDKLTASNETKGAISQRTLIVFVGFVKLCYHGWGRCVTTPTNLTNPSDSCTVSLMAQTVLCGVVALCYQHNITKCHNSTQRCLSP